MGTIKLTIEGATLGTVAQGGGLVITKSATDADVARMIAAFGSAFAIPGSDAASVQAIFERWFGNVVSDAVQQVLNHERSAAAQTASDAVQPISVT